MYKLVFLVKGRTLAHIPLLRSSRDRTSAFLQTYRPYGTEDIVLNDLDSSYQCPLGFHYDQVLKQSLKTVQTIVITQVKNVKGAMNCDETRFLSMRNEYSEMELCHLQNSISGRYHSVSFIQFLFEAAKSQNNTVPSTLPLASILPLGLNDTVYTIEVCPVRMWGGLSVNTSHR